MSLHRFYKDGGAPAALMATAAMIFVAACVGFAKGGDDRAEPDDAADKYMVGLFGDMPYNALGKAQYPALLADINAKHVAFSVFDGDLKSGGDGACTDSLYTTSLSYFNTLKRPIVWLPGDNDWTDCWGRYGPGTGGFDPLERLAHERQLFTSTSESLGQKTMPITRQSDTGGLYAAYSENVRWSLGPVVYIGLNVQGSNDNYPYAGVDGESRSAADIAVQRAEEVARKAADLAWLHQGFAYARQTGASGVMVIWQADPNFNNEQHLADSRSWDAYADYIGALRGETMAFAGQVALVHGDAHYFKMDKPLNGASGGVLANFTRVETFGARNTHWVSATVDATNPNLFGFEPRIVAANTQ
jgi:hypothetical protein